jgi:hypothetical protein
MKSRFRAALVFASWACVAGCAVPATSPATSGTAASNIITARNAGDAITIGKSTKADVIAALGKTTVVSFDSGFEVWVYRILGERVVGETAAKPSWLERILHAGSEKEISHGKTEFVILFAPSGVVAKTRIRPAPARGEAKGS